MISEEEKEQYDKIRQLLRSNHKDSQTLGIELLLFSKNNKLLLQLLEYQSGVSLILLGPLIPFLQSNRNIWEEIKAKISDYNRNYLSPFMNLYPLELENVTIEGFCQLASKKVREFVPNFPDLSPNILDQEEVYSVGVSLSGSNVVDGIGWTLLIDSRDIGPAEAIHQDNWRAHAYHATGCIKVERRAGTAIETRVWMDTNPF